MLLYYITTYNIIIIYYILYNPININIKNVVYIIIYIIFYDYSL